MKFEEEDGLGCRAIKMFCCKCSPATYQFLFSRQTQCNTPQANLQHLTLTVGHVLQVSMLLTLTSSYR